ncbi:tRNA CCA-pyrophosphorylase [Candidatus Bathyarchaeota archaeon]|nr:tRNA CCA-pyrophosphorylase [Candidatus Bathyarchaeota archaeon]
MEITVTLITGRTAEQGVGKEIGKTSERYQRGVNYILLNPRDAERIGVEEGAAVEVSTLHGSTRVWCKLSEDIEAGMAFIPLGPWANRLFDPETHGTGIPSVKGVEAKIRRAEGEPPTLEELLKELKG